MERHESGEPADSPDHLRDLVNNEKGRAIAAIVADDFQRDPAIAPSKDFAIKDRCMSDAALNRLDFVP